MRTASSALRWLAELGGSCLSAASNARTVSGSASASSASGSLRDCNY